MSNDRDDGALRRFVSRWIGSSPAADAGRPSKAPLEFLSQWMGGGTPAANARAPARKARVQGRGGPEIEELEAAARALRARGSSFARARLATAIERVLPLLAHPPRLALFGEFNTGKSTLAHMLARTVGPATGIDVRTVTAVLIRHAGDAEAFVRRNALAPRVYLEIVSSAPILAHLQILDMPGLSDPVRGALPVAGAAHDAQLVAWCTSATQAWKASDVEAWSELPARLRAASVLVVTRLDALASPEEGERVVRRLTREAGGLFRHILPVSAKLAARALGSDGSIVSPGAWRESGLAALEERLVALAEERRQEIRRRAGALLGKLAPAALGDGRGTVPSDTGGALAGDWRHVIDDLAAAVARGGRPIEDAAGTILDLAASVRSKTLAPWLGARLDPAHGERVLELLDFDRPRLMALLAGRPAEEAAGQIRGIGAQIASEIGERLVALAPYLRRTGGGGLDARTAATLERLRDGALLP